MSLTRIVKQNSRKIISFVIVKGMLVGSGVALGVKHADRIRTGYNYLLFREVPIEEGFYGNPYNLRLQRPFNEDGNKEVYIIDKEHGHRRKIDREFFESPPYK